MVRSSPYPSKLGEPDNYILRIGQLIMGFGTRVSSLMHSSINELIHCILLAELCLSLKIYDFDSTHSVGSGVSQNLMLQRVLPHHA